MTSSSDDGAGRSASTGRRLARTAAVLTAGAALLLLVLVGVGYALTTVPSPSASAVAAASRIVYADGHSEIGRVGKSNRTLVPLSAVSEPMQKAVLAAEDRSYYSEPGISVTGIVRAVGVAVRGGTRQGGSTITQQYVKNAYLTSAQTYTRKIREAFIAVKLSRQRSKDRVLADYLNTVYFGRGADGVQVAAKTYFGKDAKDLTAAEGAVLAGLLKSPSGYDPARHPRAAAARWEYVLDGMVRQGWLTPAARKAAVYPRTEPRSQAVRDGINDRSGPKGYVIDRVEQELTAAGVSESQLAAGGLVVRTTLRAGYQTAAVDAVTAAVPAGHSNADPVAALVSIKPGTGEVYAYVAGTAGNGGTDYASDALRQPGSSFKPYTLAAALETGTRLDQRYDGSSPQTICGQEVSNDSGDPPLGETDLVKAMALSVNTVYYRLACDVGPAEIAAVAHAAGVPQDVRLADAGGRTTAGITLGQYEVHVIDQAAGFATFAAHGTAAVPFFVEDVTSSGRKVYTSRHTTSKAFDPAVAADATVAMEAVVADGTGTRAALDGRPTAGKTGTTSGNRDAWFCGFVPQLATAVWVGRPDDAPLTDVLGSGGSGVYGGTVPASIFQRYMDRALRGVPVLQFPAEADVAPTSASPSPAPSLSTAPSPTAASASPEQTQPQDTPSPQSLPTDTVAPVPVARGASPPDASSPSADVAAPTTTPSTSPSP